MVDHDADLLQARSESVSGIRVLRDNDVGDRGMAAGGERIGGLRWEETKGGQPAD
jgi:hypothetical protein